MLGLGLGLTFRPACNAFDYGTLSPSFVYRDVNHVLISGQSLSTGGHGVPVLSTSQPYSNLMFNTGVRAGASVSSFVPLVESAVDPNDITSEGETIASGMSSWVTRAAREDLCVGQPAGQRSHDMLVSDHGVGGFPYAELKKGTTPWAAMQAQVTAGKSISAGLGLSHVVRGVLIVHGEKDLLNGNITGIHTYDTDLAQWQADYDTDVKAITGQTDPVVMFQTQLSSWVWNGGGGPWLALQQLSASVASGGKIVMVGPKYIFPYVDDGVHMPASSYRWLGEYYAKAYKRVILEGLPWEPLRPRSIVRTGANIDVDFYVPVAPLVLDTTRVSDPGAYGFEFSDDSGAHPDVASVQITGDTSIRVTLWSVPVGANQRLRYACVNGTNGGPTTGPRGCLRDSDNTPSRYGNELFNWCVHFDEAVQ